MIWLKIALVVSLMGGAYGAVRMYDKNAKELGEARATIELLSDQLAESYQTIEDLRTSRDDVNERMRGLITDNNAAVEAEVERRRQVALERDRAREALRIALDAIRTESENDAEFAHWLDQPVPAAAWDRLRAVSE